MSVICCVYIIELFSNSFFSFISHLYGTLMNFNESLNRLIKFYVDDNIDNLFWMFSSKNAISFLSDVVNFAYDMVFCGIFQNSIIKSFFFYLSRNNIINNYRFKIDLLTVYINSFEFYFNKILFI